jgi:hypothetical protein
VKLSPTLIILLQWIYAMLSTGFSSPVRPLTPCSEEEDESISISIGSNLWKSILINTNSESIGHDKMRNVVTISTKFDSSLPKKTQICFAHLNYPGKSISDLLKVNISEPRMLFNPQTWKK